MCTWFWNNFSTCSFFIHMHPHACTQQDSKMLIADIFTTDVFLSDYVPVLLSRLFFLGLFFTSTNFDFNCVKLDFLWLFNNKIFFIESALQYMFFTFPKHYCGYPICVFYLVFYFAFILRSSTPCINFTLTKPFFLLQLTDSYLNPIHVYFSTLMCACCSLYNNYNQVSVADSYVFLHSSYLCLYLFSW